MSSKKNPLTTTVREVMSTEVVTLGRNNSLALGEDLMKQARIRHLPVLDDEGLLCGLVSQRDLFRGALVRALGFGGFAERKMLEGLVVKEVMTTEVVTIDPDTTMAAAAAMMMEKKIGCLPVVEGEKLVGILTEGDFVALAAGAV
jgi:CBS domain-containing protein